MGTLREVRDQQAEIRKSKLENGRKARRKQSFRFFQVAQLGVLDLAVNLGERLLAAHGQEGVAED